MWDCSILLVVVFVSEILFKVCGYLIYMLVLENGLLHENNTNCLIDYFSYQVINRCQCNRSLSSVIIVVEVVMISIIRVVLYLFTIA